jgi:hypothetical protein
MAENFLVRFFFSFPCLFIYFYIKRFNFKDKLNKISANKNSNLKYQYYDSFYITHCFLRNSFSGWLCIVVVNGTDEFSINLYQIDH